MIWQSTFSIPWLMFKKYFTKNLTCLKTFIFIIDIIISAVYYEYLYNTECPIDLYLCTISCPHCLGKLSGEIFV